MLFLKDAVRGILLKFGYVISKRLDSPPIDLEVVYLFLRSLGNRKILTIQVGANDGRTNDPIFNYAKKYSDKIILIEPQHQLHSRLKSNYADFNGELEIHGLLILPKKNTHQIYSIKEEFHRSYAKKASSNPSGIASTDREHVIKMLKKHGFGEEASKMIQMDEIGCTTLENILGGVADEYICILQIDCEGADWLVLKTLNSFCPAIINFEKKHLSNQDLAEVEDWLDTRGYVYKDHGGDCLAVRL